MCNQARRLGLEPLYHRNSALSTNSKKKKERRLRVKEVEESL
jgi:hypothetical protein